MLISSAAREPREPARDASSSSIRARLAHHQTSFVGRAAELRRLRALAGPHRVVNIVGPTGVGKSRLALELSRSFERPLEIALRGACEEPALIDAIASALGVRRPRGEARADALGCAAEQRGVSLVICDGCEGLTPTALRALSRFRAAAPEAAFVSTSQRPLGLRGEHQLTLGPLRSIDARALLLDRVFHARGGTALGSSEREGIDALLERLSNLPLALELAASRLAVLDVESLLERLARGLGVLDRDAALTTTASWAIGLLSETDRRGLAQATVFDGDFDLSAAEAVIDLGPARVIDWLQRLARRSLVSVRRSPHGPRYEIYEAVGHAAGGLLEADERRETELRFSAYFAHAAAERTGVPGASVRRARRWMRREHRNLSAAERHATDPIVVVELILAREVGRFASAAFEWEHRRVRRAVQCARAAGGQALLARALVEEARFLRLRGRARDAGPLLEEALAAAVRTRGDEVRALALVERGRLLADLGQYEAAQADLDAGLALDTHSIRLCGDAHVSLGVVAYHDDRLDTAERAFDRARTFYERAEDDAGQAIAVANKAAVANARGQLERARRGFAAAVELHRQDGNLRGQGIALSNLGNVERRIGRYEQSRAHLQEALRRLRSIDDLRSASLAHCFLGRLDLAVGAVDCAEGRLESARERAEGVLPPRDYAMIIEALAEAAEARGELARAAELREEEARLLAPPNQLSVAADGTWFATESQRVCLTRRRSARLVLSALIALRQRSPHGSLSRDAMVEAGWPGERILEKAARQRLYVLINTLRKLGLDALQTTEDGYRLDPDVPLSIEA